MSSSRLRPLLILLLAIAAPAVALAAWPSDPLVNLAIADRASEQVTPIPAVTSDGGCYIGWFDLASGNYDVYLQRLDASGNELWPHNGVLISNHPQSSSLVAWDMTVDGDDNAILIFSDTRAGSDLDNYAYKVSPEGDQLWGPDGVTLSTNDDFEPGGCVTVATDGDLVFAWSSMSDTAQDGIYLQRLSPEGVERYPHNGIFIAGEAGKSPAFPDIVPSLGGSVIVSWVRDISAYMSPRHIHVQRFDAAGAPLWASYTILFDLTAVPMGYAPRIQPDGAGGMVAAWHAASGTMFNSYFQRLGPDGVEAFAHNGVTVSTNTSMNHIDPTLAWDPEADEAYVFWNERNSAQTNWGIYGQRFSSAGTRLWGGGGMVFLSVNALYKNYPRAVPCAGGAMVFWSEQPTGSFYEERLVGLRADENGAMVWPGWPIAVSSLLSTKHRYPVVINDQGMAVLVWEDDRNGTVDLYGQNVNLDGTLGAGGAAIGDAEPFAIASGPRLRCTTNPASGAVRFALESSGPLADARLRILDAAGRPVHTLELGTLPAGSCGLAWDGTDALGRRAPAGVYLYRLDLSGRLGTREGQLILID